MYITKFSRISTTVCPGLYASVVCVSDGEGGGEDPAYVAETLLKDRDSLDTVAFDSEDGDVLSVPGIHRMIKQVKPSGLGSTACTDGGSPDVLDDLLGAEYVDNIVFRFHAALTPEQRRSIAVAQDYGCGYTVAVSLVPGMIDEDSLKDMARTAKDCRQFLMRSSDPAFGDRTFKKKELEALARSVKGLTKHPVLI